MKKTIAEILDETLHDKHVTFYMSGNDTPVNSGVIKKVSIESSWDGESVVFLLDKGFAEPEETEYFFEDVELEVC